MVSAVYDRASYDVDGVVLQPLHDLVIVRVVEEEDAPGGVHLSPTFTRYEGRSLQGEVVFVGIQVTDPDLVGAHGRRVIFDDADCPWWRGGVLPNYLGAVLGEGDEYVVVPASQILAFVEEDDGGD